MCLHFIVSVVRFFRFSVCTFRFFVCFYRFFVNLYRSFGCSSTFRRLRFIQKRRKRFNTRVPCFSMRLQRSITSPFRVPNLMC